MPRLVNKIFRYSRKYSPYSRNERNKKAIGPSIQTTNDNSLVQDIISQLKHNNASERASATDMIIFHVNEKIFDQINLNQRKDLIKQLSILLLDDLEKVRFGALDALRNLSSFGDPILHLFLENPEVIESIITFLYKHLLNINFDSKKTRIQAEVAIDCLDILLKILDLQCSKLMEKSISKIFQNDCFKRIFIICFQIQLNLDNLNLLISSAQCLMVILDTFGSKFVDKELETSLMALNGTVEQNIINSSYQVDDTIPTGCLYLKCILNFIFQTKNESMEDKKLKENFFQLLQFTIQHGIESNLVKMNEKITGDSYAEMKSFDDLSPLYHQLKFILLAKQFYLQWLINLSMKNFETDGDDEIMLDLTELNEKKIEVQNGISWQLLDNDQKTSILKIVFNEFNRQCNYRYSNNEHPYTLEIKDLYIISIMDFFNNVMQCDLVIFNDSIEMEILIDLIFNNILKNDMIKTDDQVLLSSFQLIQQYCHANEQINLGISKLNQLKILAKNAELKIYSVKIIAHHLQKFYQNNHPGWLDYFNKWFTYLLGEFNFNDKEEYIILNAEIFDSIIDILSNESLANIYLAKNSSILKTINDIANRLNSSIDGQTKNIEKKPVVITVMQNMAAFLDYLNNI